MALIAPEDRLVQTQTRPTLDLTKIIIWIVAGALPWIFVILTVRHVLSALASASF